MKTKADIQAAARLAYEEKRLFAFFPDETIGYNENGHCCAIGAAYKPEDGLDSVVFREGQYEIHRINAALPRHLQIAPDALTWARELQIAHDRWTARAADVDPFPTEMPLPEREAHFLKVLAE